MKVTLTHPKDAEPFHRFAIPEDDEGARERILNLKPGASIRTQFDHWLACELKTSFNMHTGEWSVDIIVVLAPKPAPKPKPGRTQWERLLDNASIGG